LLTGAPRTATVRAIEGAVVYEIGKHQYEPIIRARPELVEELGAIMEKHIESTRKHRESYETGLETLNFNQRISRFFFGSADDIKRGIWACLGTRCASTLRDPACWRQTVQRRGARVQELLSGRAFPPVTDEPCALRLQPYKYLWLKFDRKWVVVQIILVDSNCSNRSPSVCGFDAIVHLC